MSTARTITARSDRQLAATIGRLVLVAVLLWAAFVGIGYLLARPLHDTGLEHWDGSIDRSLAAHRTSTLNNLSHIATYGAETITVVAAGLVAFVLLRWRLGRWREALFLAVSIIGEVSIFVCITLMVNRHRPSVHRLDSAPPTSSFPSGHTAASVSLYGSLAVIAWHAGRAGWLRTLATVAAVLMPISVASSRLYRGMHYPTDVLAGALLAVLWLSATHRIILHGAPDRRSHR